MLVSLANIRELQSLIFCPVKWRQYVGYFGENFANVSAHYDKEIYTEG